LSHGNVKDNEFRRERDRDSWGGSEDKKGAEGKKQVDDQWSWVRAWCGETQRVSHANPQNGWGGGQDWKMVQVTAGRALDLRQRTRRQRNLKKTKGIRLET